MQRLIRILAAALSALGFALWIATGLAVRRSLGLLEREIVLSAAFSLVIAAVLAFALLGVMIGLSRAANAQSRALTVLEVMLALAVYGVALYVVASLRVVGDTGPRNPVSDADALPPVVSFAGSAWLFHVVTAAIAIVTLWCWRNVIRQRAIAES